MYVDSISKQARPQSISIQQLSKPTGRTNLENAKVVQLIAMIPSNHQEISHETMKGVLCHARCAKSRLGAVPPATHSIHNYSVWCRWKMVEALEIFLKIGPLTLARAAEDRRQG